MDTRNVRLLKAYPGDECKDGYIYVDESARAALNTPWEEEVRVLGSREVYLKLAPLHCEDMGGYVARVTENTFNDLNCVVSDDVLLYSKDS